MRLVLVLMLLAVPQTETAEFSISLNGLRVGTERFSVLRRADGYRATGRTELNIGGETVIAESTMDLDGNLNPLSYEFDSGDRRISVEIGPDASTVEISVGGEVTSYDVRFPTGGMIVDDNFFHHYALLLDRVGEGGGSIPVFVPQQLTTGTLRVEPMGEGVYELVTENLRLTAVRDEAGRLVRLTGQDTNVLVERQRR